MKAWTYEHSCESSPYWRASVGINVILVEYDDGTLEWRRVDNGAVHKLAGPTGAHHKACLLDPRFYPSWYRDMDVLEMDEGL